MKTLFITLLTAILSVISASAQKIELEKVIINKDDCTITRKSDGKVFNLYGDVQIVEDYSSADFCVKLVDAYSFADICVKMVNSSNTKCCEFQKVNSFGNVKVKIVDAYTFADICVKLVDSFPKINRQ
ncbi:MAG: hypothetical protein K5685_02975 [Bacteroidales bacterium]|nr:hypothetical protein [Bacteroidales bacterium]